MTDIWLVVGAGAFATFMWRFAGIVIAKHINPDSLLMVWVNAAAHAMVASVMSIILVYPVGSLATTEMEYRGQLCRSVNCDANLQKSGACYGCWHCLFCAYPDIAYFLRLDIIRAWLVLR